uniref:Uncharacterized protein n=1 Tax=Anguilla anguilla TaxID=7936 RepID=A0A0E9U338_ANGAN
MTDNLLMRFKKALIYYS